MMRALWTAASGMVAQQLNIDTISNNIANINTTGYKRETTEFKTLLYQTIQDKSTDNKGATKPVGIQVGLGVRSAAISSQYTQGPMVQSDSDFSFAIQGKGFFAVQMPDDSTAYTRNGAFQTSLGANGTTISDSEGRPLKDTQGNAIVIDSKYDLNKISIDKSGNICYPDASGNPKSIGIQIGLVQFNNPTGLEKIANSLLKESVASGAPLYESQNPTLVKSQIKQGYLEGSNVQTVDEMVNMIVAQRSYELDSKAIQASDEMLKLANNLKS
jgi:fagellar hook-basal body proteins